MRSRLLALALAAPLSPLALAADPPALLNYQGVLRDANDRPRDGSFDMVFRFMSASLGGDEILVDGHTERGGRNPVVVSGGLFNVALGGGVVSDGSGPGTYGSLAEVFRDYPSVWLQVRVGGEDLSPRVRIVSAAYALNATNASNAASATNAGTATNALNLGGFAPDHYLDTSTGAQRKSGTLRVGDGTLNTVDLGVGSYGVNATGTTAGGFFSGFGGMSSAYLGYGNTGVWGSSAGEAGHFENFSAGTRAVLAAGDDGVRVTGLTNGGSFGRVDGKATAWLATSDKGIDARGTTAGGYFSDTDSGAFAFVADGAYKILGAGQVSFVQNHPYDHDKVLVYAAPEGDETAVYTRGTGRLVGGEARVALGATFRLVANPDVGLTAHLTPRGTTPVALAVASVTPEELVVRGPAGSDAAFDYLVYGLRIGFEQMAVVQEKTHESYIPSMNESRALFARRPELRGFTALERFRAMAPGAKATARTAALRDAIHEYDPAVDPPVARLRGSAQPVAGAGDAPVPSGPPAPVATAASPRACAEHAPTADAIVPPPATTLPVSEPVEAGDVLAVDPLRPGSFARARAPFDPLAVVVASGPSVETAGRLEAPVFETTLVRVKVDASYGAVRPGDLLVASATPGHAMKAPAGTPASAIVGKALEPLEVGQAAIRAIAGAR